MSDRRVELPRSRARLGWWLFVGLLAVVAAWIAISFVGILVLGIFGYYAMRPINDRLARRIDSDDLAAWATVLVVMLPVVLLILYAGIQLAVQAQQVLGSTGLLPQELLEAIPAEQRGMLQSALQNPLQFLSDPASLGQIAGTLAGVASMVVSFQLRLALAITLTAFLLANDDGLAAGFRDLVGGTDTAAFAYAAALDEDFESVWFGNFLFVLLMAVVATATYWGTNVVAPAGLQVPMVFVLGFLTGVASLIPMVVGKIVYIPVVAALAVQATQAEGTPYAFVGAVFLAYFLVLDFLPQTFVQPYVSGRELDTVMMMFGYLLGPILFGWYGIFLLPMVFIVILQAIRIVVPNLVRGEPLTSRVELGEAVGTTPRDSRDAVPDPSGEETADGGRDNQKQPVDGGNDAGIQGGSDDGSGGGSTQESNGDSSDAS